MSKVKRISLIVYIVCACYLLGGIWIKDFIFNAIGHNMTINLAILILLVGSIVFAFYSANRINAKYRHWERLEKDDDISDVQTLNRIFGKRFSPLVHSDGKKKDELISAWIDFSDWKARILDYLSGTLIGLGLLGTFIGLMDTMGSISEVLGAASGEGMVKAIAVPLSSMSSAFSASLMGLLSSLSVGLLGMLVDRLNSEFIESVKTWIYNRTEQVQNAVSEHNFSGLTVDSADTLSHAVIKNSLAKIDTFCHQAEHFLMGMDSKIDTFKDDVAHAIAALTHEVIKITEVTDSINRLSDVVLESNQQVCKEIVATRKDLMALNQLSVSLNEDVKNEILLNRKDIVELTKHSDTAANEVKREVLANRNELLQLSKVSMTLVQQFESHKNDITARMVNLFSYGYENFELMKEIKSVVDNLEEHGRYSKKNIDRVLTLQAICHDAGLVSLDEIVKLRGCLDDLKSKDAQDEVQVA